MRGRLSGPVSGEARPLRRDAGADELLLEVAGHGFELRQLIGFEFVDQRAERVEAALLVELLGVEQVHGLAGVEVEGADAVDHGGGQFHRGAGELHGVEDEAVQLQRGAVGHKRGGVVLGEEGVEVGEVAPHLAFKGRGEVVGVAVAFEQGEIHGLLEAEGGGEVDAQDGADDDDHLADPELAGEAAGGVGGGFGHGVLLSGEAGGRDGEGVRGGGAGHEQIAG